MAAVFPEAKDALCILLVKFNAEVTYFQHSILLFPFGFEMERLRNRETGLKMKGVHPSRVTKSAILQAFRGL